MSNDLIETNKKYIYCLSLEQDRYYIGISHDPEKRFLQHQSGNRKSALYTKKYKPLKILFTQDLGNTSYSTYAKMENQATINLMSLVGCYKVRGGNYLNVDDYEEFIFVKNTLLRNKSSYTFPKKWLQYTFQDFMTGIDYTPKSIKDILFQNS